MTHVLSLLVLPQALTCTSSSLTQHCLPAAAPHPSLSPALPLPLPLPSPLQKYGKNFDELEPKERQSVGGTVGGQHRKEQMAKVHYCSLLVG